MNATYYCQVARLSGLLVRWQMRNCISGHSGIRQGSEPISCIVVVVIVVVVVGSWVDMLGVSLMNSFTTNVETDRQLPWRKHLAFDWSAYVIVST